MKILKRYIIQTWFKSFLASFVTLFLLVSIANLITGLLRDGVTANDVFANYMIQIFNYISLIVPISSLTASVLSMQKMKNNNELTAIYSLGIQNRAILYYILTISFLVGIMSFITVAFIRPKITSFKNILIKRAESKFTNLKKEGLVTSIIGSGYFWYKSSNQFIAFKRYDNNSQTIHVLQMFELNNSNILSKLTKAKLAHYKDEKWITDKATIFSQVESDKNIPIQIKQNYVLPISEKPSQLKRLNADIKTLNIVKLIAYIKNLKRSGINTAQYMIILYSNINLIFITILMAVIGMNAINSPNNRNGSSGKNILFIFIFALCYWLAKSYLIEMGKTSKISPELAVFALPVIFFIVCCAMYYKNKQII